ncbi:MAG: hypothetical protein QOD99_420, partial [Chthoniobacter sp.]|nr:hypothetical protein [Chthoniobacter sp.]
MASQIIPETDQLSALQHNAEWAATFMPSATGTQRVRYKQDIADYFGELEAQRAAHLENRLQTDKVAQDYYFNAERMTQREELADKALAQRHEQFVAEQALNAQRLEAEHARITADQAREAREMALQKSKDQQAAAADFDTAGFIHGETDATATHGRNTPAYHQAIMDLHGEFPAADQQHKAPYIQAAENYFRTQQVPLEKGLTPYQEASLDLRKKGMQSKNANDPFTPDQQAVIKEARARWNLHPDGFTSGALVKAGDVAGKTFKPNSDGAWFQVT